MLEDGVLFTPGPGPPSLCIKPLRGTKPEKRGGGELGRHAKPGEYKKEEEEGARDFRGTWDNEPEGGDREHRGKLPPSLCHLSQGPRAPAGSFAGGGDGAVESAGPQAPQGDRSGPPQRLGHPPPGGGVV